VPVIGDQPTRFSGESTVEDGSALSDGSTVEDGSALSDAEE
jgi:hypothetical protein